MKKVTQENNFIFFTLSLVVLLLANAVASTLPPTVGNLLSQTFILTAIGGAYYSLSFGPRWRPFVATVVILLVFANALRGQLPWNLSELMRGVIGLAFFAAATYNGGRQVLFAHEVTTNTMVGALAIYLLLGIVWSSLYIIALYFNPTAFHGIEIVEGTDTFPNTLYFSYVTLTTLGYGDITPSTRITQTLAFMEAIAGTFYLAIVVASLVSARRQQSGN